MTTTATLALFLWPVVAALLYARFPLARATVWNFLGAQMFLPVGTIKFAMIPGIDKTSVPTFCALIAFLIGARQVRKIKSRFSWAEIFLLMYLASPLVSSLLNGDAITYGERVLPGLGWYDGLSAVEAAFIVCLPFYLGRKLLCTAEGGQMALTELAIAGTLYSFFMLIEIRLSPQFHYWVYGYQSSQFAQSVRGDSYRPMVFMGHGLLATFFLMSACIAMAALRQVDARIFRLPAPGLTGYLFVVLVWCRSLGTTIYGALGVPLVLWASPKACVRIALVLALLTIGYPLLRSSDLIPTAAIMQTAEMVSTDRAGSVRVRFENEDRLLAHAVQRPWFGWGRFGRSRVYDPYGNDISVTDGRWIITLGQFGLFGFAAEFGLLAIGIWRAHRALKLLKSRREAVVIAALALILAFNLIDLLPNSTITPLTFLFAGALTGRVDFIRALARGSRAPARATVMPRN